MSGRRVITAREQAQLHLAMAEYDDYAGQHQSPGPGTGFPIHDMSGNDDLGGVPDDWQTHPQYYASPHEAPGVRGMKQTQQMYNRVNGKPDEMVDIYRALPHGNTTFNTGDWVTPSRAYAQGHAASESGPEGDLPIIKSTVPAKHLWQNGDSYYEMGYHGPSHAGTVVPPGHTAAVDPDEYDFHPDADIPYAPKTDEHGNVELYHRTHPEHADSIVRQQRFNNAEDDPVYFSTHADGDLMGTHYGPAAVKVNLPADKVRWEPSPTQGPDAETHGFVWPQDLHGVPIERHAAWYVDAMGARGDLPELTFSQGKTYQGQDAVNAFHGDKHVGQMTWRNHVTPGYEDAPHPIDYISTHPEYRRMGVGTAMLNHVRDNIDPLISHSPNVTPSGKGFAKSDGFKPPPYYNGDKGKFEMDPVRDDSNEWPDAAIGNGSRWGDGNPWDHDKSKIKDQFSDKALGLGKRSAKEKSYLTGGKCKYCKSDATHSILHSEGMAYVQTCGKHLQKGKDAAAACVPFGDPDPSNIDKIYDLATKKVIESRWHHEDDFRHPERLEGTRPIVRHLDGTTQELTDWIRNPKETTAMNARSRSITPARDLVAMLSPWRTAAMPEADMDKLLEEAHGGGFSMRQRPGDGPKPGSGTMVSTPDSESMVPQPTRENQQQFLDQHQHELEGDPDLYAGGWKKNDHEFYNDISRRHDDPWDAAHAAVGGSQDAVYDYDGRWDPHGEPSAVDTPAFLHDQIAKGGARWYTT